MWQKAKAHWLAQLHQQWVQESTQLQQAHEQRCQQLKEEAAKSVRALLDIQVEELRQVQQAQERLVQESQLAHTAQLAQEEAAFEEQKAKLRAELIQAESDLRMTYAKQSLDILEQHQQAHRQKMLTLEVTLTAEVETLQSSTQHQLETLRKESDQRLEQWQTSVTHREAQLRAQQFTLEQQQRDLADLSARNLVKKEELVKSNDELATQIRLLEAKAKPDAVWVEAFSRGYEKAWDTLSPLMMSGVEKSKEVIRRVAIDETLANLSGPIQQKAIALGQLDVREKSELLTKYEMFRQKRDAATKPEERDKYSHYLTALEWALNGHQLPQDQTVPQ